MGNIGLSYVLVEKTVSLYVSFEPSYVYILIVAIDRHISDMPTEIFSQGLEEPLAREREKPL